MSLWEPGSAQFCAHPTNTQSVAQLLRVFTVASGTAPGQACPLSSCESCTKPALTATAYGQVLVTVTLPQPEGSEPERERLQGQRGEQLPSQTGCCGSGRGQGDSWGCPKRRLIECPVMKMHGPQHTRRADGLCVSTPDVAELNMPAGYTLLEVCMADNNTCRNIERANAAVTDEVEDLAMAASHLGTAAAASAAEARRVIASAAQRRRAAAIVSAVCRRDEARLLKRALFRNLQVVKDRRREAGRPGRRRRRRFGGRWVRSSPCRAVRDAGFF